MDLFDLSPEEFEKELEKLLNSKSKEELLQELVECGLELTPEEENIWIDPLIIETEEELTAFVDALEAAAAHPVKEIYVKYKNVNDKDEIKKIFENLK
jgi:tRNA nucleotidyltransferase/poly(A) polymerase